MISKDELKEVKEIKNTNLYYAEKEYLQYIFLNAVSKKLANKFVFKGGTCLRIAFELERASEDLDFNTSLQIKEIKDAVRKCLNNFSLLNIPFKIYSEKMFEGNYRIEVRFQGPLYSQDMRTTNTIKIDFNRRPAITKEPRLIKKLFSDVPPFTIIVMQRKEIFAEKIRALIARQEPRDLYDVWVLISLGEVIDKSLVHRKLREEGIKEFKLKLPSKKEYKNSLKSLLKNIPVYEDVVKTVKKTLLPSLL